MRRALGTPQTSDVGLRGRSFDACWQSEVKAYGLQRLPSCQTVAARCMKGLLFDELRSGEESFPIFQVES